MLLRAVIALYAPLALAGKTSALKTFLSAEEPASVSPLSDVLLLVRGLHGGAGKVEALEHYRPYFWDMMYLQPHDDAIAELEDKSLPYYECVERKKYEDVYMDHTSYACLGDMAMKLINTQRTEQMGASGSDRGFRADTRQSVKGILFIHADFWITPAFLQEAKDLDSFWYLPNGVSPADGPHACYETLDEFQVGAPGMKASLIRTRESYRTSLMKARALLEQDVAFAAYHKQFCVSWSDLYYIPRQQFSDFHHLADMFSKSGVLNEYAIFTTMTLLQQKDATPMLPVNCWGGCNKVLVDVDLIESQQCGHKMDLRDPAVTQKISEVWQRL